MFAGCKSPAPSLPCDAVVDTDYGEWSEDVPLIDSPGFERAWREDRIEELLAGDGEGTLFVSGGCVSNQGKFSTRFDAVDRVDRQRADAAVRRGPLRPLTSARRRA